MKTECTSLYSNLTFTNPIHFAKKIMVGMFGLCKTTIHNCYFKIHTFV